MENLQITKEAAITAYENAKDNGKKLLEDLFGKKTFLQKVTDRITTMEDVLSELGIDPTEFEESLKGLDTDDAAYRKIKLIVKALNQGWTPDWGNSNETKYIPWFKMGSSSGVGFSYLDFDDWHSRSRVGSRLCFKSRELAEHAGKTFENIYKDFFIINN